jgi:hypothetical protein
MALDHPFVVVLSECELDRRREVASTPESRPADSASASLRQE